MKRKLITSLIMVSMVFTGMPQGPWAAHAAGGELPDPGNGDAGMQETVDAIAQVDGLYEGVDLGKAEEKEFGTKTLIVQTSSQGFDTFGAEQLIQVDGDTYALSYPDMGSAGKAYQEYKKADWVEFVEPDGVVGLEDVKHTQAGNQEAGQSGTQPDSGAAEILKRELPTEDGVTGRPEGELSDGTQEAQSEEGLSGNTETGQPEEGPSDGTEPEGPEEGQPENTELGQPGGTEPGGAETPEETQPVCIAVIDTGVSPGPGTAAYLGHGDGAADENGHGTQVANLIADSLAQAGVAPGQAGILPVKVADADGRCTVLQLYLGIKAAAEQGADILNISLGTENLSASFLLGQAMEEVHAAGAIAVTSAGNDGADVSGYAPANISSTVTVGSVNRDGGHSPFSNYGETIDCVSFGEALTVTGLHGERTEEDGTSYAAALVTAELAAQMAAGALHTPQEADAYIQGNAKDLGAPGWDGVYGYGLVGSYSYTQGPEGGTEIETETETEAETEAVTETETETGTEAETEAETETETEASEEVPETDLGYLQKVSAYNLLIGDIQIMAENVNIESTRLLAGTMKKSAGDLFENQTDIHAAFDGEAAGGTVVGKSYAGTGNAEIDGAAKGLEAYLKECALDAGPRKEAAAGFEERLDGFVEILAGFQGSEPLARDVSIQASTAKTAGDAATLQSIAQTAGDFTVKLTRNIAITSEIVVTNGCTLRLQSNKEGTRRTVSFGTLPASAKTSGMCMFRVNGLKKNRLIIGKEDGTCPVTLDGKGQPHNGFLIYNSTWAGNADAYNSTTKIYPGTVLKNNVMFYDSSNPVNGASGSAICNYGTLYLYGGTIEGNGFLGKEGAKVGEGGGIANYNRFYMSGGEIKNNVATNGNGILAGRMGDVPALSGFEMKVTGGSIHDNGDATNKKYTSNGGGILINPNTPVVIGGGGIDSVKIYGNMADYGGGIANYGLCELGKCKIYGNYSESEGGGILNQARAGTAVAPVLNIEGAYVYKNFCSKTDSSYAGGIASLKRRVGGKYIVPIIRIASGYFYDNDGFSIHIDSGTLSFGANARFGFSSYSSQSSYRVTEEWRGSGVCNTGGTVNVTGSARMFVPEGATGIKNTGTLNIEDGADFMVFCKDARSAIQNTGKLSCGKAVSSGGKTLYPYTIDGSAEYGIENTGGGTAYLTGRVRGNFTVRKTAKTEDDPAGSQKIGIGIYNASNAAYSAKHPYAASLQGGGYVACAQTGIYNNTAAGSVSLGNGEVGYCAGTGLSNKGKAYMQGAGAGIHHNGKEGVYNFPGASLTVSAACSIYNNGNRGIYNGGTTAISGGAKVYGNAANGVTNGEGGVMTISGAADVYDNGENGIRNYNNMAVSGPAKVHGNKGHGLENSGTTILSGNTDIYGNGKAGINNGAGHKLTMAQGTVRGNAAGGVLNGGTFELDGGSVTGNKVAGIYNKGGAAFTMAGGSVSANTGNGGGVYNEASGTVHLNGGFLYGNAGYGVHNLGACNISGIKIGFASFASYASYAASQNASGGVYNSGTLRLVNGGFINGGNASAVANAGTMDADAGATTVLMSISADSVLNNSGKLTTAHAAGKTPLWVLGGNCRYGIKNTGSMKFSGNVDGRYRVTANAYALDASARGFTEAAIYNSSASVYDKGCPYAGYLYGDAQAIGSAKDGIRTDKGTIFIGAAHAALNKNGVSVGSGAVAQLGSANARVYSNGVGIYNNGTVDMAEANIHGNTEHGVYQDGTFYMSGAAKVNVNNDVCLPAGRVVTVKGALTTEGLVAKVTPLDSEGEVLIRITSKESEQKGGISRIIVKTSYTGSKGSDALFYDADGYRFALSNGGVLRPGDYMDREILAKEKHAEISDKDIVISNRYTVAYEKNIDEKDGDGNPVDVAVADMPENQDKFWCENLQMPNPEGTYAKPSVLTEPYALYYRFLNWNSQADGLGGAILLPMVYKENADMAVYALWQKLFNVAYIGNGQSMGTDFTEFDISQESTYTFNSNREPGGEEHFTKDIENSYIDEETGEEVKQETTATAVQWSLDKEAQIGDSNYGIGNDVSAGDLFRDASNKQGAITNGAPNTDYGLFPKLGQAQMAQADGMRGNVPFAMSGSNEFSMNLFAAAPAGQPFVNLYAVWDEGPMVEAYDLYYTLEEAQGTTDTTGITMEELLRRAEATDKEDGVLPHGEDAPYPGGKKTTFTVSGYAPTDFSSFTAAGSVSINYRAVDTAGNVTNKMVTVYIVDTRARDANKGRVRFISEKYLDTLAEDSIWRVDSAYYDELAAVLANHREGAETFTGTAFGQTVTMEKPGTGTWVTEPEQTWVFTHEQVEAVKAYVEANGIGKTRSEAALDGFLAQFAACRR
jgi:hypothetical protein